MPAGLAPEDALAGSRSFDGKVFLRRQERLPQGRNVDLRSGSFRLDLCGERVLREIAALVSASGLQRFGAFRLLAFRVRGLGDKLAAAGPPCLLESGVVQNLMQVAEVISGGGDDVQLDLQPGEFVSRVFGDLLLREWLPPSGHGTAVGREFDQDLLGCAAYHEDRTASSEPQTEHSFVRQKRTRLRVLNR